MQIHKFILPALFLASSAYADLFSDYQSETILVYQGKENARNIDEKYCKKGLIEACISQANSLEELNSFEKQYQNACLNKEAKACDYELLILHNKIGIFTKNAIKNKDAKELQKATALYDTMTNLPNIRPSLKSNIYKAYYLLASTNEILKIKEDKPERLNYAINAAKQSIDFYTKEQNSNLKSLELYQAYHFLSKLGDKNFQKVFGDTKEFKNLQENHKTYSEKETQYRNQFWNL